MAIWHSAFVHIREDLAEVMRAFDLGATVLRPIRIALVGNKGVDSRYLILLTSNIRTTIDPENSAPMRPGWVKRAGLSCTGPVHPKVQALRPALEGPAIWTDPTVSHTLFVNDALAQALLDEPFGRDLQLKQVRLVEVRQGLPNPAGPSA